MRALTRLLTKRPVHKDLLNQPNYFSLTKHNLTFSKINYNLRLVHNFKDVIKTGPGLSDFIASSSPKQVVEPITKDDIPYIGSNDLHGYNRKVYLEVQGCQMNINDTEIVWSILKDHGYQKTELVTDADVVLLMTCSIRERAESKIWDRLKMINAAPGKNKNLKVGILGCMAERLKHKVLDIEKRVDLIAGPDSYKDLPRLLALTRNDQKAVNVLLSLDETYADIMPVRLNENSKSAFVSIMRGCDNMCTYCIVPFTRGRERSRPISSILDEVRKLSDQGVKEVTLLGQNVNSYRDMSSASSYNMLEKKTELPSGFKTVYKPKIGGVRFDTLLDKVSQIDPEMRIRFTSPHPKDFPDEVLNLIKERKNICCQVHLPVQSGSTAVLERMRRGYSREAYLQLVQHVRSILPQVTLTTDIICGFCGETEEDHRDSVSLLEEVKYSVVFFYPYSMREKTTAHRRYQDDVPKEVKLRRCQEIGTVFRNEATKMHKAQIGQIQLVLVEGVSRKSEQVLAGRNDGNIKVLFSNEEIPDNINSSNISPVKPGDYVAVLIKEATSQTLRGIPLYHSSVTNFNGEDISVPNLKKNVIQV